MLFDFILNTAFNLLNWFISLFPVSSGFPSAVSTAVSGLGGYLDIFSPLIPISTLATVVGLVFTVELSILAFKTTKWLISHLPFIGGKGV